MSKNSAIDVVESEALWIRITVKQVLRVVDNLLNQHFFDTILNTLVHET